MWLIYMKDAYAIQSFERGIAAQDSGAFAWEIVPVRFLIPSYLSYPINCVGSWTLYTSSFWYDAG